jgi:2-polyprenyl-3-methyl-5-hydroxy-6-metoxy-1,4-benzoquinol methylase
MSIVERVKTQAVAWGDGLLPPGPVRDRAVAVAKRAGIDFVQPTTRIEAHLLAHQIALTASQQAELTEALKKDFFGAQFATETEVEDYLATEGGTFDLNDHLTLRLERDRATVIPWLDSIRSLAGLRVLEVGAGDGASTVALAEQGATVLATDVNERSLKANAERCRIAGLKGVGFATVNADNLSSVAKPGEYDMIAFYAALEHMTFEERLASIEVAWKLLNRGGVLVVIEAPNRLWFFDDHTSMSPFFLWLPDDVAARYAAYTPREDYNSSPHTDPVEFARWGRGVSFHDFVLALGIPAERLPVRSCMHEFLDLPRWKNHTRDGNYLRILRRLAPNVPKGFFFSYLDIALQK